MAAAKLALITSELFAPYLDDKGIETTEALVPEVNFCGFFTNGSSINKKPLEQISKSSSALEMP